MGLIGSESSLDTLTIRPHLTQPFLMHIDPDRILIVAGRHFAQIEFDSVKRLMDTAVISDIFQDCRGLGR